MIKKKVTFKALDGRDSITKEFMFHIAKQELVELDASFEGGLEGELKRIEEAKDNSKMYMLFTQLIAMSFGVVDEDPFLGQYFKKDPELTRRFIQSPGYEQVFMEIVKDTETAKAFFNGVADLEIV